MSQTRLHLTLPQPRASEAHALLESGFEDDGWPIALVGLDEPAGHQRIELYVDGDPAEAQAKASALLSGLPGLPPIEQEVLPDIDWVAHSLAELKPVRAGRFIVHGAHDRARLPAAAIAIEIEAGLAFGTGHHGTTAGCLEMIERIVRRERPRRVMDLGTGSAVLAIAVARLARIPVLATDIDPVAVKVAAENARHNRVGGLVATRTATGFQDTAIARGAPYDLIIANILARPLMRMAPQMAHHLRPGGSVLLSGILDRQRAAVIAAYAEQRFRHVATLHKEGWSTLHLKR